MLKQIFAALIFSVIAFSCFSQDAKKSKFAAGLNIGYKTANGLGLILSYQPNRVVQVDVMAGYTRYNGAKFGGGGKIYPFKPRVVNPFIAVCYSISTGAEVKTSFKFTQHENYRTYSNQYILPGLGMTIHGEETHHSLQIGYSFNINDPVVTVYPSQTYKNLDKVKNSVKGGIMATYTLFIFFNKPGRR